MDVSSIPTTAQPDHVSASTASVFGLPAYCTAAADRSQQWLMRPVVATCNLLLACVVTLHEHQSFIVDLGLSCCRFTLAPPCNVGCQCASAATTTDVKETGFAM
jgi:hypothetical protein